MPLFYLFAVYFCLLSIAYFNTVIKKCKQLIEQ